MTGVYSELWVYKAFRDLFGVNFGSFAFFKTYHALNLKDAEANFALGKYRGPEKKIRVNMCFRWSELPGSMRSVAVDTVPRTEFSPFPRD